MEIEKQLAEYRAKKRREQHLASISTRFKSFFNIRRRFRSMSETKVDLIIPEDETLLVEEENELLDNEPDTKYSALDIFTYILYFVLWCTLFAIFIKLEFGLVFVTTSALLGMYLNTRTGPRKRDEVSAYSVFNKNCESINGTLKAEQFEREIRYGSGAIH